MIEIENLTVVYDGQMRALNDVSCSINQSCTVIIGENGSGKSTLLKSILNLVEFSGIIMIDGMMVEKKHEKEIRNKVGMVFQNPDHQLFMNTIYDDLAFGLINQGYSSKEIEERVASMAGQLALEDVLKRSSHKLSGGQKRKAAIGTVLVMDPDIILLDEPSAFLDPKNRRSLINTLKSLDKDLIIATHDLDLALDLGDEVILLEKGQMIKQGLPEEILLNQKLLEEHGLELPLAYQGVK